MLRLKHDTKVDLLLIFTLFLPVFWEQLASIVLTMISSMISSNIDTSYLNATSLVGSVFAPFTTLYSCIATGASILISQYMGAQDSQRSRSLFSTSMILGTGISLAVALCIIVFRNPILRASYPNMSEHFFESGNLYAIFYALSLPMGFFRSNMIGILRGSLDTKGPFYISLFSGVLDIALRYLSMVVLDMGIIGLGLSSIASGLFNTVICAVVVGKAGSFNGCITSAFKLYRHDVALEVVKIGAVMCAQSFLVSIGGLVLSSILTTMGDAHVSAYSIVISLESFIHIIPMSLAFVAQILAGKHTGASNKKLALDISVRVTVISTVLHMIFSLAAYFLAGQLVGLYTDDAEVLVIAERALQICLIIMPIGWSAGNSLPAGIRGMGNVKLPALVLIVSLFLFKIPLTWYVCTFLNWGAWGRMLVYSLEYIVYMVCFVIYYIIKYRKLRSEA